MKSSFDRVSVRNQSSVRGLRPRTALMSSRVAPDEMASSQNSRAVSADCIGAISAGKSALYLSAAFSMERIAHRTPRGPYIRSGQRFLNKARSNGGVSSVASAARISPTTLANLNPCPEQGLAISTFACAGWRSIQKCSSGVLV